MPSEFAPAKINLHLHVTGRRDDGYHLLHSLVVFGGVGDRLTVEAADGLSLSVTGPFAAGLDGEADNLVLRAARALAEATGCKPAGRLVLEKNLPVSSGIGGGSADAAAALRLLGRFWGVSAEPAVLAAMAKKLGADVPVCLAGQPAAMSGIGEILEPAGHLPPAGIVLVNPGVAVSTPSVFKARSGGFSAPAVFPRGGWQDVEALAADLRNTRNDLEPPARLLAPAISDAIAWLETLPGCRLARMSGSGATCFGLFDFPEAARRVVDGAAHPGWWIWGGGLNPA
jgi:4-diphosphocytidyl-2-C-methyl-D-erythritol kinase